MCQIQLVNNLDKRNGACGKNPGKIWNEVMIHLGNEGTPSRNLNTLAIQPT